MGFSLPTRGFFPSSKNKSLSALSSASHVSFISSLVLTNGSKVFSNHVEISFSIVKSPVFLNQISLTLLPMRLRSLFGVLPRISLYPAPHTALLRLFPQFSRSIFLFFQSYTSPFPFPFSHMLVLIWHPNLFECPL